MKKKFCSVPFNSVHLVPGGDVYVCGWTDEKTIIHCKRDYREMVSIRFFPTQASNECKL